MEGLFSRKFRDIDFNDPFFDSLKEDYKHGFLSWVEKKKKENAQVFVLYNDEDKIDGFLYLKDEYGIVDDIVPCLVYRKILKIGTFKLNSRGTLRGERFLKIIFNQAIKRNSDVIYVTVFEKHTHLIKLFSKFGFSFFGTKKSESGSEMVLVKTLIDYKITGDVSIDYPLFTVSRENNFFLLSIKPNDHSKLFPDSFMKSNVYPETVIDISHANSIKKIYMCAMHDVKKINKGDIIFIYRTNDGLGSASERSAITSVCVAQDVAILDDFKQINDYLSYCSKFSVMTDFDLVANYYTKRFPYIISFTYNLDLPVSVTRSDLINNIGLNQNAFWGVMKIDLSQAKKILYEGEVSERFIIYKT